MTTIDRSGCRARLHGTYSAYRKAGCRCADAEAAHTLARARQRAGRPEVVYVSAIGSRRRIHKLVALEYTYQDIANAGGLDRQVIHRIGSGLAKKVMTQTAAKVKAAYDSLSLVDEVLVERVVKGGAGAHQMNPAEKREAARQMRAKGKTANQIALRLHWNLDRARKVAA